MEEPTTPEQRREFDKQTTMTVTYHNYHAPPTPDPARMDAGAADNEPFQDRKGRWYVRDDKGIIRRLNRPFTNQ